MPKIVFTNSNVEQVFADHKCTYSDFSNLLIQRVRGTLQDVTPEQADGKIRQVFCDLCGVNTDVTIKEAKKAVRRHRIDLFEVIEEIIPQLITTGWDSDPFFREYVEIKNLALGDTNEFRTEDDTILLVNRVSGGHWDIKRQRLGRGRSFTVETEAYAAGVYAEFERLLAGYENWSTLVGKISEAFTVFINNKLFASTMAGIANVPNAARFKKTLDFTATDASRETILDLVEDVRLFTRQEVAILGVRSALARLRKLDEIHWISPEAKNELYQTGRLGRWMGIPLVEIPNALAPNTYDRLVDSAGTKLLVMPTGTSANNKFIKLVYEGAPQIREVTQEQDNLDMTSEYMYIEKFGLSTLFGYQFGTVDIEKY